MQQQQQFLKTAKKVILILNKKHNQTIIDYLRKFDQLAVNQIYGGLGLEQSITSQALRELRNIDAVTTERKGKLIYYSLKTVKLDELLAKCKAFETSFMEL